MNKQHILKPGTFELYYCGLRLNPNEPIYVLKGRPIEPQKDPCPDCWKIFLARGASPQKESTL